MSDTPNLRNFKEFRKELLAAFGVNRSLVEVDDEEFKGGLLEGLGVTYKDEDLKNFERYRAKLIEGVLNYSGGGGGDSDLSLCKVTIVLEDNIHPNLFMATVHAPGSKSEAYSASVGVLSPVSGDTYDAILYKHNAYLGVIDPDVVIKSASGDADVDDEKLAVIWGDCTITVGGGQVQ